MKKIHLYHINISETKKSVKKKNASLNRVDISKIKHIYSFVFRENINKLKLYLFPLNYHLLIGNMFQQLLK